MPHGAIKPGMKDSDRKQIDPDHIQLGCLDWLQHRAYAIWESEGHPDGRALANWLQAEEDLCEATREAEREQAKRNGAPASRATAVARL